MLSFLSISEASICELPSAAVVFLPIDVHFVAAGCVYQPGASAEPDGFAFAGEVFPAGTEAGEVLATGIQAAEMLSSGTEAGAVFGSGVVAGLNDIA